MRTNCNVREMLLARR